MIDGKRIRRNARNKARAEVDMMHEHISSIYIKEGRDEAYISEIYQSQLRGALKGVDVKFKLGNLDIAVLRSTHFNTLARALGNASETVLSPLRNQEVLEFLNDCMMVECCGDCVVPTEESIGEQGMVFVNGVWDAVFAIFYEIVDEFEEFYFTDFFNKTHEKAGKLYATRCSFDELSLMAVQNAA